MLLSLVLASRSRSPRHGVPIAPRPAAVSGISSGTISVPSFALALILVYLFAYKWQIFPIFGWTPLTEDPWENLQVAQCSR